MAAEGNADQPISGFETVDAEMDNLDGADEGTLPDSCCSAFCCSHHHSYTHYLHTLFQQMTPPSETNIGLKTNECCYDPC